MYLLKLGTLSDKIRFVNDDDDNSFTYLSIFLALVSTMSSRLFALSRFLLAFGIFAFSWSDLEVAAAKFCKRNKWVKKSVITNLGQLFARKAVFSERTLPRKFICFVLPVIVPLLRKVDLSLREMHFTPRCR